MLKNRELEIKMMLLPGDIAPMKNFIKSLYLLNNKQIIHMTAYYYDTADHSLSHNMLTYRVRKENSRYIATIKGKPQTINFITNRLEINRPVNSIKADINVFSDIELIPALADIVKDNTLTPLVTNNFKRQQYLLFINNSKIELVIDTGFIYAGIYKAPICELELELKSGQADDLLLLATTLQKKFSLKPSLSSKFSRGLNLINYLK